MKIVSYYRFIEICIFTLAFSLRIPYLGIFPPGNDSLLLLRIITAAAGIVSSVLFIEIVHKISRSKSLALISGFVLTCMPWHIEQSRVYSESMLGLTVLLGGVLFLHYSKNKYTKIAIIVGTIVLFLRAYPSFWIISKINHLPTITFYIGNIFKLISFEFLFFQNDSFWFGGLRSYGIFLTTTVGIFVIGLLWTIKEYKSKYLRYVLGFLAILLLSAAHPSFPEQREYFLSSPFFAFIMSYGVYVLSKWFVKANMIVKTIIFIYVLIILYDTIVFAHFYTSHYPLRIKQEVPYEKRFF